MNIFKEGNKLIIDLEHEVELRFLKSKGMSLKGDLNVEIRNGHITTIFDDVTEVDFKHFVNVKNYGLG